MSFRGRGRGRGGRGRFGGGFERSGKKEPYILFPDITLPSLPTVSKEEMLLIRSQYRLEQFWKNSCYFLEKDAYPSLKDQKSKAEDVEIERYSDRFKQRTTEKREALESYLILTPSNFPAELIKGARRVQPATKKLRWDSGAKRMDAFAKLEEKLKGKDDDPSKKDESEDEPQEGEEEDEEDSDDGDYAQNKDFDDDEDDINMDEEPDEDTYD